MYDSYFRADIRKKYTPLMPNLTIEKRDLNHMVKKYEICRVHRDWI